MNRQFKKMEKAITRYKSEIEESLTELGGCNYMYKEVDDGVEFSFDLNDAACRMMLRMPIDELSRYDLTRKFHRKLYASAVICRWGTFYLLISCKISAIKQNMTTLQSEFLPHLILPEGNTMEEEFAGNVLTQKEKQKK